MHVWGPCVQTKPGTPQQDLEALIHRDNDLKKLKLGLVARTHQPLLSWRQQQEAFENYLSLIYGPSQKV